MCEEVALANSLSLARDAGGESPSSRACRVADRACRARCLRTVTPDDAGCVVRVFEITTRSTAIRAEARLYPLIRFNVNSLKETGSSARISRSARVINRVRINRKGYSDDFISILNIISYIIVR